MTPRRPFHPRLVEHVDDLSTVRARWENEGGAREGQELSGT